VPMRVEWGPLVLQQGSITLRLDQQGLGLLLQHRQEQGRAQVSVQQVQA